MKLDETVFVYDPKRESIYECKIKNIIKSEDGEEFAYILTPSNPHLPQEVKLSKSNVFKTFEQAFHRSLED